VFAWVLERLAERGLVQGERIGIDASTMAANAAMRSIRRREDGESYREMLTRMAEASGMATPTAAELKQFDRERKGKRLSNLDWASPTDPEARIARLQDGRTRLAYKPEHAVDLDTEAIVAAEIQPADHGDTTTLGPTLEAAARGLGAAGCTPTIESSAELIADQGYHSRAVLKGLAGGPWRTRIAEPKPKEVQRWCGDLDARRAVYGNRARRRSGVGQTALALRAEKVERSFALTLDRGENYFGNFEETSFGIDTLLRGCSPRPFGAQLKIAFTINDLLLRSRDRGLKNCLGSGGVSLETISALMSMGCQQPIC
jgi:hypothetical protein